MDLQDKKGIIIKEFETLVQKETVNKNFFKVRAYRKVIEQINGLEKVINMDDLKNIEGIGEKINKKLEEIFETGKLKVAEIARTREEIKIYDELTKIHGIGIVKAEELIKKYNIKSIDDLLKRQDLLTEKQKIALYYYKDLSLKIPRNEMVKHERKIKKIIKQESEIVLVNVVGSYRRGSVESGDIDVIISPKKHIDTDDRNKLFKNIIKKLKDVGYLISDFGSGNKKYLGICKLNDDANARRIDILMTSYEEYPYALLYFTGDYNINIALRKKANILGYKLSEYGLRNKNNLNLKTEKQIFKFLGFEYLKPKDRNISNLVETK